MFSNLLLKSQLFCSVRLALLHSTHVCQLDRYKTSNYLSDPPVADWSRFNIKPPFLIGGRLIGASLLTNEKVAAESFLVFFHLPVDW